MNGPQDEAAGRAARLAAALRANLRRRKDQRRERNTADTPVPELPRPRDTDDEVR